jgi:hypothetical protein
MALVCGPGSRKHSPLPQSGLELYGAGGGKKAGPLAGAYHTPTALCAVLYAKAR